MANAGFQLPYTYQPGIQFAQQSTAPGAEYNPWQFPGAPPTYTGSYDPNTMGVESDPRAMDQFRKEALREGPSRYATLANQQQDTLSMNAKQSAADQNAGSIAQGQNNLAMSGGLDSGARERLQTKGNQNLLDMNQKINQTSANNKMQIGMNDEQNRVSQLGQVPGMQNQQNQAAEFNVGNAINEGNTANTYKYGIYNTQMKGYAAGQQAAATQNSGGGSWLCTEAEPGEIDQKALLKFKRYALRKDPVRTKFYIYDCQELVARMKKQGANWQQNSDFVKHVAKLAREGKFELAYKLYFRKVKALIGRYWHDCESPIYKAEVNHG
jgi:hypothetical protein